MLKNQVRASQPLVLPQSVDVFVGGLTTSSSSWLLHGYLLVAVSLISLSLYHQV